MGTSNFIWRVIGGLNSTFYLQNRSGSSNYVTLTFYGRTGYGDYSAGITLTGNGSGTISTSSVMGSIAWVGSVRITTSAGSVAAKIYEGQGSAVSRTFSAVAGGKSLLYVPAAYKNKFNLTTGLVIQNLHPTNPTNVTVTYCDRDYTSCSSEPVFSINANRAAGINVGTTTALPASWTGSIKIQSSGGAPLGIAVTNSSTAFSGGYDFNGTNFGSKVVTLPRAAKNAGGRTTGYTIRNVSGQNNVTVKARYYDTSGNLTWTRTISPINAGQVKGFFQGNDTSLSNGWEGSIVLESTADIIAIMREDTSSTYSGYNGIPR